MIPVEIKAKIISQYNGCEAKTNYPNYKKCTIHGANIYGVNINSKEGFDIVKWEHKPKLLLKNVKNISDIDAIAISKIESNENYSESHHISFGKEIINYLYEYDTTTLECRPSIYFKISQYLQSQGYALPYMDYSVNDLVKEGIYKLKK